MKRTILAAAALLLMAFPAAASSPSLTAEADPASTLPGLPVRLRLTVNNTSSVPLTVPHKMVLEVRAESGEPFLAAPAPELLVAYLPDEYRDDRTVAAGQSRVFDVPLAETITDGRFADSRLWTPGTYGLRLLMHDDLDAGEIHQFGVHGLLAARQISTPLFVTSEATLHIEQPAGTDAEIWSAILAKTGGRGLYLVGSTAAEKIATELLPRVGDSAYMPYLHGYVWSLPLEKRQVFWKRVLELDPNHPVAEGIRLGGALRKAKEAEASISKGGDLDSILRRTDEARAELQLLASEAKHDLLRVKARTALNGIKSRERIVEMHRELAPKR
jgi:hypothetical protein